MRTNSIIDTDNMICCVSGMTWCSAGAQLLHKSGSRPPHQANQLAAMLSDVLKETTSRQRSSIRYRQRPSAAASHLEWLWRIRFKVRFWVGVVGLGLRLPED